MKHLFASAFGLLASLCLFAQHDGHHECEDNKCALPIVLNYFRYDAGAFTWQTAQESNTASFQVQLQQDGQRDWSIVGGQPAAGNSSTAISYSMAWAGYTVTAGLGALVVIGLVLGMARGKKWYIAPVLLMLVVASCTKSMSGPVYQVKGSYRLVTVDKDGLKSYSKIIHL